jgi:release factor glutamine methyltransferase
VGPGQPSVGRLALSQTATTVGGELGEAVRRLKSAAVDTPILDAQVLLAHVLKTTREFLRTYSQAPVGGTDRRRFRALVTRRTHHVPIAYLIGSKEFFGHRLRVSPAVLIPRPETETLVEAALGFLKRHPSVRRVIDLGTGSGAVGIAIAAAIRRVRVDAIEVDARAIAVARMNVQAFHLSSRIRLRRADLLQGAGRAGCIVANLPYLSLDRRRRLSSDVRHEPKRALNGGRDGLDLIRRALIEAPHVLQKPGCLLIECDPAQARRLRALAERVFPSGRIEILRDLSGRSRAVQVTLGE